MTKITHLLVMPIKHLRIRKLDCNRISHPDGIAKSHARHDHVPRRHSGVPRPRHKHIPFVVKCQTSHNIPMTVNWVTNTRPTVGGDDLEGTIPMATDDDMAGIFGDGEEGR
jgi:hypothetical protein